MRAWNDGANCFVDLLLNFMESMVSCPSTDQT